MLDGKVRLQSYVAVTVLGLFCLAGLALSAEESAAETRRQALEALSRQDLVEAERIAVDWLRQHPDDADVLLVLGLTRFAAAQHVESRRRPRPEVLAAFQDALEVFLAVERLDGGTPRPGLDYAVGYVHLVSGRPKPALKRLTRALRQTPQRQDLYRLRGSCHLELGNLEASEADLRRAVELDRRDVASRLYHAQSLFLLGREELARETLDEAYDAIADEPPDQRHWQILFDKARYSRRDLEAARAALEAARRIDPSRLEGRLELAIVYYRLGELEPARRELEHVAGAAGAADDLRTKASQYLELATRHEAVSAPSISQETRSDTRPFTDATRSSGLAFRHTNGAAGQRYIVEIMGAGGGFVDYDVDGDPDVLLLNGGPVAAPGRGSGPGNRLFDNDGRGRFRDVTGKAGVGHRGHAMGLAVGDVDNDGDPDLYVTNYGADVFYRNRGDATFEDATSEAGLGDERWTTSAAFFDYDLDGDLDLYVAGYLDFDPAAMEPCESRGVEIYCGPLQYEGIADRLYRNDGTGRFTDVSAAAGIAAHVGKGLGVVAGDFDGDGDSDLYVANDYTPNFLFVNRLDEGRPLFTEEALALGAALSEEGKPEAGMGVDMGDYDGDGDPDLVVTNLEEQTSSLYRNEDGLAVESSFSAGLGPGTWPWVGFGTRFLDYDLDGDLDLVMTHGHILDNVAELRQGARFAQPNLVFENRGGRFREVCRECLPAGVGRGLATGDVDGDGDTDVLVTNNGGEPYLFLNVAEKRGAAIGLALEGAPPRSSRDAYGARVTWRVGTARFVREVRAAASYASSSDPRLLLAVPDATRSAVVSVRWPGGGEESFELAPGTYYRVVEGEGIRERTPFTSSLGSSSGTDGLASMAVDPDSCAESGGGVRSGVSAGCRTWWESVHWRGFRGATRDEQHHPPHRPGSNQPGVLVSQGPGRQGSFPLGQPEAGRRHAGGGTRCQALP